MGNTNKTFVINTMTETKYSELAKKGKILQTQLNIVDDDDRNRTTIPSYDLMNDKIAGTKADLERKITLSVQTIETEIDKKIDDTVSAMTVTLSSAAVEGDIEKVYTIRQGESDVGTIEIPKDKVITGAHYDVETNKLVLSVANVSTAISIDLSGLIDINDLSGISSDTVSVTASGRTISADINEKSVGAEHLTDGLSSKIALVDTLGDYMRLSTFNDISNDTGLSAANSGNPVQTLSDITSVVNAVSVALSNDYVEKIAAEKERAEAVEAGLAETLNFVSSDYLTSADYESLSTYTETSATEALRLAKEYTDETSVSLCADYTELVNAEKERADGVEKELSGVLNFVSSDYLTNTDKTNLKAYTVACAKQASADAVAEAHKQFVHISGDTINGNVTVNGDFNVEAVYDVNIYSHDNIQLSADNISLNPSVKLYVKGKEFESYLSDHTTVKSLAIQPGVGSISTLVLTTTDSAGTDHTVTCDMQGFVDHANEASAFALTTAKTYTDDEIAKISTHTAVNSFYLSAIQTDEHSTACSTLIIETTLPDGTDKTLSCDIQSLVVAPGKGLTAEWDQITKSKVIGLSDDYALESEMSAYHKVVSAELSVENLTKDINDLRSWVTGEFNKTVKYIDEKFRSLPEPKETDTIKEGDVITVYNQDGTTTQYILQRDGNTFTWNVYYKDGAFVKKSSIDETDDENIIPMTADPEPENQEENEIDHNVDLFGHTITTLNTRIPSSRLMVQIISSMSGDIDNDFGSVGLSVENLSVRLGNDENTLCAVLSDYLKESTFKSISCDIGLSSATSDNHVATLSDVTDSHKAMISGIYEALSPLSSKTSDSLDCSALFPVMINLWNAVSAMWETYNK